MDENASRAIFLGVSVLVAIITITLILNFYTTAKDAAGVANRFDITSSGYRKIDEILDKKEISGVELRYLLNYCVNNPDYMIVVNNQNASGTLAKVEELDNLMKSNTYWTDETQAELDEIVRPNYTYVITRNDSKARNKIVASFSY